MNKGSKIKKIRGSSFSGLSFRVKDEQRGKNKENKGVLGFGSPFLGLVFGLFLSPQGNENQTKVNTVLIGTKFRNKGAKIKKIRGSSFSGLRFWVLVFGS